MSCPMNMGLIIVVVVLVVVVIKFKKNIITIEEKS